MSEPQKLPLFDAYIDESSQTGHRYLVLGGVILPTEITTDFTARLTATRVPELDANGEMKWVKVSNRKLPAYLKAVDLFFEPEFNAAPHFHSLVVDTHKVNNRRYNQGNREIGFSKEIYQLAMKFGRLYRNALFHIYPDHRTTDQLPENVRTMLNFGIRNKGDKRDWPYRRMQFRHSHHTPLIQLADIFSGALAYHINGHHSAEGASPAKRALSQHILDRARIKNPSIDTAVNGKFTIWHRQLK